MVEGSAAAAGWSANSLKFWTAAGRDVEGAKTEHISPDTRGNSRYVQGSTAGYFAIYDLTAGASTDSRSLKSILGQLPAGQLPDGIPAKYELLDEGETDVTGRIDLGGKGQRADGGLQTHIHDSSADTVTFCSRTSVRANARSVYVRPLM